MSFSASAVTPVTAVIPVHNRADLLKRLLQSVRQQTTAFQSVIVVDNASTDQAADLARGEGCRVIDMGANTGFARAANAGWRSAPDGWIAILNSDVELAPDWLERLLAEAGPAAFVCGAIFDAFRRNVVDGSYDLISRGACPWRAGHGSNGSALPAQCSEAAIPPATACLYRRAVLEQLGGFDESFESYLEDVDLGLRAGCAGYKGIYVPRAVAWHHGSATLGRWNPRVVRLMARNQVLLIERHYDSRLIRKWWWPVFVGQMLWGMVALRHGTLTAWLAGKWEGLRNFRTIAERSATLEELVIRSEEEIRRRSTDCYWRLYFMLTAARARGRTPSSRRGQTAAR